MPADFKRESTVQKKRLIKPGLAASVTAAVVIASLLALASGGKAASPNVCATSSISASPPVYASCVKQTVFPHTLNAGLDFNAGQAAVSSTKFVNESGGATATHTGLITTFSSSVQVNAITVFRNGTKVVSPTCTPALALDGTYSVTCSDIGSTSAGKSSRLLVQFSVETSRSLTIWGSASYGESGSDQPGGPNGTVNDRQRSAPQTVGVIEGTDTRAQGKCTSSNFAVSGGDSSIASALTYGAAADQDIADICTPAATGITPSVIRVNTQIVFADVTKLKTKVPSTFGGLATLKLFITPLPSGVTVKNAPIYEDVSANQDFTSYIIVPPCTPSGAPPNPGVPAAPATQTNPPIPQVNDSCIYNRSTLPRGGGEFDLHIFGSSVDPRYGG
jgi:hypothetical protein